MEAGQCLVINLSLGGTWGGGGDEGQPPIRDIR